MAHVILSTGPLAREKTRTFGLAAFSAIATMCLALVFGGGVALGMMLGNDAGVIDLGSVAESAEPVEAPMPVAVTVPTVIVETGDNGFLIERFGELTGKLLRLETEARNLVSRISALNDFEDRIALSEELKAVKGRLAKTQPGSAGGPWMKPHLRSNGAEFGLPDSDAISDSALEEQLTALDRGVGRLSASFGDLENIAASIHATHLSFPGRSPVKGVSVQSGFGNRIDPFKRRRAFHSGVDFPADKGTPIFSSAGGRVIFAGRRLQYGLTVEIEHGAGLVTRYAHASKLHVAEGDIVMPGERIADVGSTGRSTGPHLHFEILKDGRFVNPAVYLARF